MTDHEPIDVAPGAADELIIDSLGRRRRRPNWTPEMRREAAMYGRIGGLRRAGRRDPFDLARDGAAGSDALLAKFEREIDPDEVLPLRQRRIRAERLLRAHLLELSARSRRARRGRSR